MDKEKERLEKNIFVLDLIFIGLYSFKILADIVSIYLVGEISNLSLGDPFKKHFIGNISNYYYLDPNTLAPFKNEILSSNETLNYIYKANNTLEKNKINFSQNYNNKHLRKLESKSFCSDIYESFVKNKNRRLSYLFDTNFDTIRSLSIPLSVACSFAIFSFLLLNVNNEKKYPVIFDCRKYFLNFINCFKNKCPTLYEIFKYALLIPWIAKFVLFLILFYFIEEGDIGKYTEFLDCKFVNKKFFKKFDKVEKLVEIFKGFTYVNIISEIIDKIIDFVETYTENAEYDLKEIKEKEKEKEKENQSKETQSGNESAAGIDIKVDNIE